MRNLTLAVVLSIVCIQTFSQGMFMIGGGSTSSPTPNASVPINTIGITNNGTLNQNGNSTFNGNITLPSGDIKVNTGNFELTSPGSKADLKGDLEVGKNSKFKGNTELPEQQLLMEQAQSEIDLLHLKLKEDKRLDVASYQLQNAVKMGAVYFGMGKSAIGTDAEAQILNVLDRVKAMPKAMHIYIVGSNSKEGNDRLNLMLATQRAIGVRDLILKHGIGKNKVSILPINADNIIPIDASGSDASKRRVEIWVLEEK